MAYYLDTSAAVKLVVAERGSKALMRWLEAQTADIVASDLLRTELLRAVRRAAPEQMERARAVLDAVVLVTLPTAVFERAADLDPEGLRSLDALHLAAAVQLGDDLDGIITFDERLAEAARRRGIAIIAPS